MILLKEGGQWGRESVDDRRTYRDERRGDMEIYDEIVQRIEGEGRD